MAWNNDRFITIMDSLGQQIGQDTSGMAHLCSLVSEAATWEDMNGRWLKTTGAEAGGSLPTCFSSSHVSTVVGITGGWARLGPSTRVPTWGLSNVVVSGGRMSPRESLPKEPGGSCTILCDLASDVTVSHLCCILLVTSESSAGSDSGRGEETTSFFKIN